MALHDLLAASRVIRDRIYRRERALDPVSPLPDGRDDAGPDGPMDEAPGADAASAGPWTRALAAGSDDNALNRGATRTGGEGRTTVETQGGDVRQRAAALIQEAGNLLGLIPQLLDRTEELKTSADSVGKETETLKKEIAALRLEVQQMKAEREEMADSLTTVMNEIVKLANEAVSKLRHPERRSAFWREGAAVGEGASGRPVSVPNVPWKRMAD